MSYIPEGSTINVYSSLGNSKFFNPNGGTVSFSIEDSIYSLNKKMSIGLRDVTGMFTTFQLFNQGSPFTIKLGINTYKLNISGKIKSCTFGDVKSATNYDPYVSADFVCEWTDEYYKKTKLHSGRISDIVKIIAAEQLTTTEINDTGNMGSWYQTQETDKEFLKRISQYCYSDNASSSPFFLWQTADDIIHLRNGSFLEGQVPKMKFSFQPRSTAKEITTVITNLKRIDDGSFYSRNLGDIEYSWINRSTGLLEVDDYSLKDIPIIFDQRKKILLQDNQDTNPTKVIDLMFSETEYGKKENQKGLVINQHCNTYFIEKYMFSVPASEESLRCRSGDCIELQIPCMGESKPTNNENLSQKYVIEKKIDTWDANSKVLASVFVIGRRTANVLTRDPNILRL